MEINESPYVVGYWACIRGVSYQEVLGHDVLGQLLQTEGDQDLFRHGWRTAEEELKQRGMDSLLSNLREACETKGTT